MARNFNIKTCKKCGKKYKPTNGNQKYCGNRRIKGSCSHERNVESKILYKKRHPKRYKESHRNLNEEQLNKKRIRERARRLRLRFEIFKRDNFTCQYCGRKVPEVALEIDHIYPKSRGGLNRMENYKTSCRDCNIGKGDIILDEFKLLKKRQV